jgi:ketosteroid isomerase-like protein
LSGAEDESAVWQLTERLAVEGVLLDYCQFVDALDIEAVANLFTEDCEMDLGLGRVWHARREVFENMSGRLEQDYTHTSHHLSNIRVVFESRDRATASSYVFAWHRQASDGRERKLFGRYFDDLVRTDEGWKIRRRRLRMAGQDGYPRVPGHPEPFELIPRRGREA